MRRYNGRLAGGRLVWALVASLWPGVVLGQTPVRPANQTIGSWTLTCPANQSEPCSLRASDWVWPAEAGGLSAALEVQRRGAELVPVIAVRGLAPAMMVGGIAALKPTVTLAFDGGGAFVLRCGMSGGYLACGPDAAVLSAVASALPIAQTAAVEVSLSLPVGSVALPRAVTLKLSNTAEALGKLRAAGAGGETLPAYPGLDLWGLGMKIMRDLGFARGP
jgi:invasion protein IalB